MNRVPASAKINLALVVGPRREDGYHEVVTVLQRVALADRITVEPAPTLRVTGFPGDTLVRDALEALADRAGVEPAWHAAITKRIPVAAGLGGGSSDAATALRLANALLPEPRGDLHEIAAGLGADVPFFLHAGPQLGEGTGRRSAPSRCRPTTGSCSSCRTARRRRRPRPSTARSTARTGLRRPPAALAGGGRGRRPGPPAAERPRLVTGRSGATRAGRLPSRRHRRRADRVRALPRPRRRGRRAARATARGRTCMTVPAWYG